jgi:hypothetical protein
MSGVVRSFVYFLPPESDGSVPQASWAIPPKARHQSYAVFRNVKADEIQSRHPLRRRAARQARGLHLRWTPRTWYVLLLYLFVES